MSFALLSSEAPRDARIVTACTLNTRAWPSGRFTAGADRHCGKPRRPEAVSSGAAFFKRFMELDVASLFLPLFSFLGIRRQDIPLKACCAATNFSILPTDYHCFYSFSEHSFC